MRALSRWMIVVLLACAAPAAAQEPEEENPATEEGESAEAAAEPTPIELAREHMERGQALYLQARFEEAASEFQAAYESQPFSAFLFNAGVALERAGQPARAADFFEQYTERDPEAADRDSVAERITRLRAAAAAASAPDGVVPDGTNPDGTNPDGTTPDGTTPDGTTPDGTTPPDTTPPDALPDDFKSLLSVRTNPEGATITVLSGSETAASGPAPFAHTLEQGRYTVRVEHPEYQTVEQEMRILPGKVYVVIVEMSQGQFLGYLRIVSNVPGAQVFIDDREQGARGQIPFEAPIPVGAHTIWVERPGYRTEESEAEVNIGEDVTVRMDLTRVDFGRLRVVSNVQGARVVVDGQLMGTVPFEGEVSGGEHQVRIEADGMKSFETDVVIRNGQLTPVRARLRPDVGRGGGYVAAVFAALFLGGGIATAVIGNDMMGDLQAARDAGTLTSDDPRIDQGLFLWIGADAGFGLALILGALSLYYFLYDPLPPSEGTVLEARDWALAPMVDPQRGIAGMTVGGSF